MNFPLLLDLISTVTRKTHAHIEAVRRQQARDTFAEWVEWLHDRIAEREQTAPPVPAYIAHRSWKPVRR